MAGLGGSFIESDSAGSKQGEDRAVGRDPRHRGLLFQANSTGIGRSLTARPATLAPSRRRQVNEILAYVLEDGPDQTGQGHTMRALQCLRQGTKGTG